jgi:uncharacterized membrane protein
MPAGAFSFWQAGVVLQPLIRESLTHLNYAPGRADAYSPAANAGFAMTLALNATVDDVLSQREVLAHAVLSANEQRDHEQAAQLEHLLETWDGLLAMVTWSEARH